MAGETEGSSTPAEPITSLHDLFSSDSQPDVEKSSSAVENGSKEEASDEKDEADQKFLASESSPSEKKDDDSEKEEKPTDKKEDKPDEKKADAADKSEKKEDKPSDEKDKWEKDENPYVKRYRDTAANWNKEHQENIQLRQAVGQLQQEMTTLRKIADGTYDPEKDDPAKQVTPERIASTSLQYGKALASETAAITQYGKEKVQADLAEFDSVFGKHSLIQQLVMNAEAPVYEAFRILDRYRFETKYGSTPTDIHKAIKAEVEKELRASIRKEITEELMQKADKQKNTPRGLSSSRGSNGLESNSKSKAAKGPTPLGDIFHK